ncbi:MAG: hypothetical protein F4150_01875 [Chloroflexi bacterium]|nr:hypothetical protein [Chloroflexota bacterium]
MAARYLVAVALTASIAMAALACDASEDGDGAAAPASASGALATVDVGGVLAAVEVIERADLHDQNRVLALPETTAVHPAWLGQALRARTATAIVDWPAEVQDRVDAFLEALDPYIAALEADDLQAARATVKEAHNAYHALTGRAFEVLAEMAGLAGDSGGDHHH